MRNDIRIRRAMRDITQEDLANALDVSRQTIIAIENGKYDPSLKLAFAIANYFKASIEEVFENGHEGGK